MKKLLLPLTILTLFQHLSFSQDQHLVDSLLLRLTKHNASKTELRITSPSLYDTTASTILNMLSKAYWGNNPGRAIEYANQALRLSEQIGYKKGIENAYSNLGVINRQSGNYPLASDFHKKSLKIAEEIKDKNGIAFSYLNIGNIYSSQGNNSEAIKNYFVALKLSEEIRDTQNIAWIYNNIGNIYEAQNNYLEALRSFTTALKLFENGDKKYISIINNNIGNLYVNQGNYQEAFKADRKALEVAEEIGYKYGIANAYLNLGEAYSLIGNYGEALKNQFAALKLFEETSDILDKAESYIEIGNTYSKQKNYKQAYDSYYKSLSIAKEVGNPEAMKFSYQGLAKLDSLQGKFKDEIGHYKLFIAYRDSLVNSDNSKKITQQQMQFDFDRKQIADSVKFSEEKEIEKIKFQKQKALTYGGFGGIAVAIILLFFVYRNYDKQREANRKLKAAQEELIRSEKMAAFGVMASRVSHEIQNPLNFVNNFSELSKEMVDDIINSGTEEERQQNALLLVANLEKINEHGKRAESIVRQLQEHTRSGTAHEFFEEN